MEQDSQSSADLEFYDSIVSADKERLERELLRECGPLEKSALVQPVAEQLAHLHARIQLLESVVSYGIQTDAEDSQSAQPVPNVYVDIPKDPHVVKSLDSEAIARNINCYGVETDNDGARFCWTGACCDTQFEVRVDRGKDLIGRIELIDVFGRGCGFQLAVLVDGQEQECVWSDDWTVSFPIPAEARRDTVQLKVRVPETISPYELGFSNDIRKLGVALRAIEILGL